jgi:hypothetical protein
MAPSPPAGSSPPLAVPRPGVRAGHPPRPVAALPRERLRGLRGRPGPRAVGHQDAEGGAPPPGRPVTGPPRFLACARFLWMHAEHGWELVALRVTSREEKWALWHEAAGPVKAKRVDVIVFIGEVWVSTTTDMERGVWPSDSPKRREALWIYAETKNGRAHSIHMPFEHREGHLKLVRSCD